MEKLDLTKKYKAYFTAKTKPEIVDIEKASFIALRGKGDPSGEAFAKTIEAMYSTAYTIKFACKAEDKDFVVSKLEGQWWFDTTRFTGQTMNSAAVEVPRSEWEYRLLIRMPDFVTAEHMEAAKSIVTSQKGIQRAAAIEWHTLEEGKCVQMLHVGPFSTEPESLKIMDAFMKTHQFAQNGLHHEIYLSDFRKTAPEKLRTILREPVK
jgi:hypothetical protein